MSANLAERKFADAMRASGRAGPTAAPNVTALIPKLRKGDVHLGDGDASGPVGISLSKLLEGRLLIQGASGAGKSWTLRRLLEQSSAFVQQILIDPEGEFRSLAEEYELVIVDASRFDQAAIATAARRAREHRLSLLLDLSELDREDQMKIFAPFIAALVDAPKHHWFPCLVAVDEAHLFAPFGGQSTEATSVRKAAIAALVDLMSRGRKRGLCGALATQRLARLSKSVVSEVHNFLIGINTLDLDIRRAAETIGWDARRGFDRLPSLQPGEFVAGGAAFSQNPAVLKVGPVDTLHTGAAPELRRPELIEVDKATMLLDLDGLQLQSDSQDAIRGENRLVPGLKAVRDLLRQPEFIHAARAWGALRELVPDGAAIDDLSQHLTIEKPVLATALALLDSYGVLDTSKPDAGRIVKGFVFK